MKFCPECGSPVARETSKFCDTCGAPLGYTPAAPFPGSIPRRPAHEEKSPLVASLCSSFIPGLGQVYNGMIGRGIAFFAGTLVGLFLLLIPGFVIWLYGIYDAHAIAVKMNAGEIPFFPASRAQMIIFAVVAVCIVVIVVIVVVLAVLSVASDMMQQLGTMPGTLPGNLPVTMPPGFGF